MAHPSISIDTSAVGATTNEVEMGQLSLPLQQSGDAYDTMRRGPENLLVVPQQAEGRRPSSSGTSSVAWDETTVSSPTLHEDLAANIKAADALLAETGDTGPFAFTPKQLAALVDPKNLELLRQMGGVHGICKGLQSNLDSGLSLDETTVPIKVTLQDAQQASGMAPVPAPPVTQPHDPATKPAFGDRKTLTMRSTMRPDDSKYQDRIKVYSKNVLPARKIKNIFQLMWIALQDKVLILLSFAAVISLSLGIYETVGTPPKVGPDGKLEPKLDWVEGVAIIIAIAIVTIVGSVNDFQKERQFKKLNAKKEDRKVIVVRSGKISRLSVFDVQVGDLMNFEPGDVLPVDGVFISGYNVKCDESAATGESDTLKKLPAQDCIDNTEPGAIHDKRSDPFMLSGSKVVEGIGKYMVTAVGVNSFNGKTMMALQTEPEDTPLQAKLNKVATTIAKLGGAAAILLFVVLFIKFLAQLRNNSGTPAVKGQEFLSILIIAVTVIVVAVPEGLPLAVTLALAFATTRMLKDNNLVRILKSCETMGNATTICSDKTGTLTQNKMTVVSGTLSVDHKFSQVQSHSGEDNNSFDSAEKTAMVTQNAANAADEMPMQAFATKLSPSVKDILLKSIALNSTAFEGVDEHEKKGFVGSKTETALLEYAVNCLGMDKLATVRANHPSVYMMPFSSEKKCMAIAIRLEDGRFRIFFKGASEIILAHCSNVIQDPFADDKIPILQPIAEPDRQMMLQTINTYAQRSLRTIGMAYKDFAQWPPAGVAMSNSSANQPEFSHIFKDLALLGIVGIMDPLRPGVKQAVLDCQGAGVFVRMVTGDNVVTARAIATECGIYTEGGLVMEGPSFRKLSPIEMDQIIPRLQVLARSSPEDKQILVKRLKYLGETVAVTGDGTNDGPALKMADVGFSMGIAGTEVAKEASAIILMDDNFSSIVKAIAWGRAVNDAVKKFLQFQVTVNITAVLLTFISAVSRDDETSVLTPVQLLWVNLIMDTLAALALATDPPHPSMLKRKPAKKTDSIITFDMWKMIIGQAIYQLSVTLVLYYAGDKIFNFHARGEAELSTTVFNTFVWLQIFNQLNNRRLDNKLNIFEGIFHNWFYWVINVIMIACQIMIIFIGGAAFSVTRISGPDWAIGIVLGFFSIPVAVIIRLIPNEFIRPFIPKAILEWDKHRSVASITDEERQDWNPAINQVRDELAFIRNIRSSRRIGKLGLKRPNKEHFGGNKDSMKRARSGSIAAAMIAPSFLAAGVGGFGSSSPLPSPGGSRVSVNGFADQARGTR